MKPYIVCTAVFIIFYCSIITGIVDDGKLLFLTLCITGWMLCILDISLRCSNKKSHKKIKPKHMAKRKRGRPTVRKINTGF